MVQVEPNVETSFHRDYLKPYLDDECMGTDLPLFWKVDKKQVWVQNSRPIEYVIDHREVDGERQFLVHYKETDASEDSWVKWSEYVSPEMQKLIDFERELEGE